MHIMFPMITTVDEFRAAKAAVREEEEKLGLGPIPVGLMIEVPAAALQAEVFAKEADFFSIGTNDHQRGESTNLEELIELVGIGTLGKGQG